MVLSKTQITKVLIRLRKCAGWSAPVLFANPQREVFSRRGPIDCEKVHNGASSTVKEILNPTLMLKKQWLIENK